MSKYALKPFHGVSEGKLFSEFMQSTCTGKAQELLGSFEKHRLRMTTNNQCNQCIAKNILLNSHLILVYEAETEFKTNHCVSSAG